MSEKRGGSPLQELDMDFNRFGVMEVFKKSLDKWFRCSERDFRSFNGRRRITSFTPSKRGMYSEPQVSEYYGPVYAFGTNQVVPYVETGKIEWSVVWEEERELVKNQT